MKFNLLMSWKEYCKEHNTDSLYFTNDDKSELVMVAEGSGDNLLKEDEEEGYVDYWNIECYGDSGRDGGFLMRKTLIMEDNPTIEDIIKECNDFEENLIPITSGEFYVMDPEEGEELEEQFMNQEMAKIEAARQDALENYERE